MKKHFKSFYCSISIKLALFFLILVVFPLALVANRISTTSLRTLRQEQMNSDAHVLSFISRGIEYRLGQIDETQKTLYDNVNLMNCFLKIPTALTNLEMQSIQGSLRRYVLDNPFTNSIFIFLDNGQVISSTGTKSYSFSSLYQDFFKRQAYIKDLVDEKNGRCIWVPSFTLQASAGNKSSSLSQQNFSLVRVFKNTAHKFEKIGYLVQNIDVSFIEDCFDNATPNNIKLLISDGADTVVWSNNSDWIARSLSKSSELTSITSYSDPDSKYLVNGIEYYITQVPSNYNQWIYYMLTPCQVLSEKMAPLKLFSKIVWIVCFAVLIIGIFFFYILITKPLKHIIVRMNTLQSDSFIEKTPYYLHNDEIGTLYRSFLSMEKRINLLMKQKTNFHKQKLNQEILTMQAQLKPHFLYNTLDTINWIAIEAGSEDIQKMIQALSQIMRYSVSKKYTYVTYADEIAMIKNYVFLQKCRFGNKFNVEYKIDPDVLNKHTERLIIQPLVENAINHGFSKLQSGGFILISIYVQDNFIIISVGDNGCGIDSIQIANIMTGKTQGIALYNTNQFIKLKYGSQYGIKITSAPKEGTNVCILLPKTDEEVSLK